MREVHLKSAGSGNRTRMTSLEGWDFTIKLCPRACQRNGTADILIKNRATCNFLMTLILSSGNRFRSVYRARDGP